MKPYESEFFFKYPKKYGDDIFKAQDLGLDNGHLHRITWGEKDSLGREKFQLFRPESVNKNFEDGNWKMVE